MTQIIAIFLLLFAALLAFWHPLWCWLIVAVIDGWLAVVALSLKSRKYERIDELSDNANRWFLAHAHYYSMPLACRDLGSTASTTAIGGIALAIIGLFRTSPEYASFFLGAANYLAMSFLAQLFNPTLSMTEDEEIAHSEIVEYMSRRLRAGEKEGKGKSTSTLTDHTKQQTTYKDIGSLLRGQAHRYWDHCESAAVKVTYPGRDFSAEDVVTDDVDTEILFDVGLEFFSLFMYETGRIIMMAVAFDEEAYDTVFSEFMTVCAEVCVEYLDGSVENHEEVALRSLLFNRCRERALEYLDCDTRHIDGDESVQANRLWHFGKHVNDALQCRADFSVQELAVETAETLILHELDISRFARELSQIRKGNR